VLDLIRAQAQCYLKIEKSTINGGFHNMQPLYDPEAVRPMWEELAQCGVDPLATANEVDEALKQSGTTLVVVNSVCGCAAGSARPGVTRALQHGTIPDQFKTVFAGVDREATERARQHMLGIPPSSPSVALFKDGELVHMLERRHIEMMTEEMVAQNLTEAFDKHCERKGPSVTKETYDRLATNRQCGSSVPRFNPFAK
jgi:putative YphP/YqiW family bacilliredoxin